MNIRGFARLRTAALASSLAALACAAMLAAAGPAAANDPYEPNDMGSQASGPLTIGATFAGKMQSGDYDYFKFYVAKAGLVSFEITAPAECGELCQVNVVGTDESKVGVKIHVQGISGTRTVSGRFPPGRYFLIMQSNDRYLDSPNPVSDYTVRAMGGVVSWSQLRAACTAANKPVKTAQQQLARARSALTRALKQGRRVAAARRAANSAAKRVQAARAKASPICSIKR